MGPESSDKRVSRWEVVYEMVRAIPAGKVMSYGQVALLNEPLTPRAVGWALSSCPDSVPWHRVVNSRGGCSTDRIPHIPAGLQRSLLEAEGIEFRPNDTLDLAVYRWLPD